VAEELISTSPEAEVILILARTAPGKIKGLIYTTKNESAAKLANLFDGSGNERSATFEFAKDNLIEVEKEVIDTLRACRSGKTKPDQD